MTRFTTMYVQVRELTRRPLDDHISRRQEGQGMVEYALILVLIAIVVILILTTVGKQVKNLYSNVSSNLGGA